MKKGNRLRSSSNRSYVGAGSILATDLTAAWYEKTLIEFARGRLLDLGCGLAPLYGSYRPYVSSVTWLDWQQSLHHNSEIDIIHDLSESLPIEDQQYDLVLASDLLEHIYDPRSLLRECERVLAPGGIFMGNTPFYYPLHESPHDYYRYTNHALQRILTDAGFVQISIEALGGALEVVADIIGKLTARIPGGEIASIAIQRSSFKFWRTRIGKSLAARSSPAFPLSYGFIAHKKID